VADSLANDIEVIRAGPSAYPWILDSFRKRLIDNDVPPPLASVYVQAMSRMLIQSAARAVLAVPIDHEDDYAGWAVHASSGVLFAYVRKPFRRNGIATKMLATITESAPIGVAFWTRNAQAISDHGFPIFHDLKSFENVLAFCRMDRPTYRRQETPWLSK